MARWRLFYFCVLACYSTGLGGCAGLNGGTSSLDDLVAERAPRPFPSTSDTASRRSAPRTTPPREEQLREEPPRQVAAKPVENKPAATELFTPLDPDKPPTLQDLASGRPRAGQMQNLPSERVAIRSEYDPTAEPLPGSTVQTSPAREGQTVNPPPANQVDDWQSDPRSAYSPDSESAVQQLLAQMTSGKPDSGMNYGSLLQAQMQEVANHMREADLNPHAAQPSYQLPRQAHQVVVPTPNAPPVAPAMAGMPAEPVAYSQEVPSPPTNVAPLAAPAPDPPSATKLLQQAELNRAQLIDTLERAVQAKDSKLTDEQKQRLQQELRLAYLAAGRIDEATEPIPSLASADSESFKHLMFALHHLLPQEADRRVPHRHALALRSLREAEMELSLISRLDLRNLAFCESVQQFGWYAEFKRREFASGQQVILYLEVENATAEKKSTDQYETELQGSYQIFNANNELVGERTLPLDKENCRNWRRDYFLAYRIYLPDDLPAGSYRLELRLEDLKARPTAGGKKLGEGMIDFTIR